ncbi:MAG: primase-helicase family protein [Pseudomonadota bacterium]
MGDPDKGGNPLPADRQNGDWFEYFNDRYAVVKMGGKAVILCEDDTADLHERVSFMTIQGFTDFYSNWIDYSEGPKGGLVAIPKTKLWMRDPARRTFAGLEFAPGAGARPGYYNYWQGFAVQPKEGECRLFLDHLFKVICSSNADHYTFLLQWFAHMIQRPHERIGTAVVLRGGQGAGKTIVGEMIGELLGAHYMLADNPAHITGQHNAHLARVLLLQADEGFWAGDKTAEGRLKSLVTSGLQTIEPKFVDAFTVKNFVRLLVTSNEHWVIPAGLDERRFAVFDVSGSAAQNHAYFEALRAEWENGGREALLHTLMTEPLTLNLRQIPKTDALFDQKLETADMVVKWWFERLSDGALPSHMASWPEWMVTRELYTDYIKFCERAGWKRPGTEKSFCKRWLQRCAPAVERRRVTGEGGRPWGYAFSELDVERACFERVVGQKIDWDGPT